MPNQFVQYIKLEGTFRLRTLVTTTTSKSLAFERNAQKFSSMSKVLSIVCDILAMPLYQLQAKVVKPTTV